MDMLLRVGGAEIDLPMRDGINVGVVHSPTGRIVHVPIMEVVDLRPRGPGQGAQSRVEPIRDDGSAVRLAVRGRVPSRG